MSDGSHDPLGEETTRKQKLRATNCSPGGLRGKLSSASAAWNCQSRYDQKNTNAGGKEELWTWEVSSKPKSRLSLGPKDLTYIPTSFKAPCLIVRIIGFFNKLRNDGRAGIEVLRTPWNEALGTEVEKSRLYQLISETILGRDCQSRINLKRSRPFRPNKLSVQAKAADQILTFLSQIRHFESSLPSVSHSWPFLGILCDSILYEIQRKE